MSAPKSEAASRGGESLTRAYWTYKIESMTGPVAQFRMAQLVDYDRRLTDPARTVYRFMIGWYMHAKHGDALASVRHIVKTMRGRAPDGARHLSRSAVQRAIVLLIECGWLVRTHTGKGRGGSRYVPVLNVLELAAQGTLPVSVPDYRDATEISLVSHSTGPVVSHSTGTLSDVVSHSTGTKTLLLDPSTDGATEREIDTRPPTAPLLGDGLAATPARGSAVEELTHGQAEHTQAEPTFEALWRAYDLAKGKKEARAAWKTLPAEVDRAAMIETATAWQASWAAQGKPDAPRKHLATWLREERYDEDAPTGYQPKEKRAKPAKPTAPGKASSAKGNPVRTTARVTSADVVTTGGTTELRITATDGVGFELDRILVLEDDHAETQFEGQRQFAKLVRAAGLEQIGDSSELLGRTIIITEDGFAAPTTRPDDEPLLPAKPEPVPYANPAPVKAEESPAAFAARMAATFEGSTWPAWMDDEYEEDAA